MTLYYERPQTRTVPSLTVVTVPRVPYRWRSKVSLGVVGPTREGEGVLFLVVNSIQRRPTTTQDLVFEDSYNES